jgi:hypothetical protein
MNTSTVCSNRSVDISGPVRHRSSIIRLLAVGKLPVIGTFSRPKVGGNLGFLPMCPARIGLGSFENPLFPSPLRSSKLVFIHTKGLDKRTRQEETIVTHHLATSWHPRRSPSRPRSGSTSTSEYVIPSSHSARKGARSPSFCVEMLISLFARLQLPHLPRR